VNKTEGKGVLICIVISVWMGVDAFGVYAGKYTIHSFESERVMSCCLRRRKEGGLYRMWVGLDRIG
jgi:hypothetical protein